MNSSQSFCNFFLQAELQRMKQQAAESKAYIEAQEAEERKLLKIIAEADAERVRQKKELDQVRTQRVRVVLLKIHRAGEIDYRISPNECPSACLTPGAQTRLII